ncbi:unnamed protein product [Orchesella dallaii]|uniref:Uncharacterized protein n=1 Tax=Orchesella dallaii TaxID=48710 RepID=A0ABP1RIS0_9HEXA
MSNRTRDDAPSSTTGPVGQPRTNANQPPPVIRRRSGPVELVDLTLPQPPRSQPQPPRSQPQPPRSQPQPPRPQPQPARSQPQPPRSQPQPQSRRFEIQRSQLSRALPRLHQRPQPEPELTSHQEPSESPAQSTSSPEELRLQGLVTTQAREIQRLDTVVEQLTVEVDSLYSAWYRCRREHQGNNVARGGVRRRRGR